MLNRILDNRYIIIERIGGGGMAEVYRAHDKLLDRSVAVKILKSQFVDDEEFVENFNKEALAAAKLSHPNIVNIYDVGCENDIYYIIMEYISGKTLKEKIEEEAPLSLEKAIHIALEIADGLDNAHQNNIIHCDVKPHNILITRSGRIKVTDFGIARAVTSATTTNTGNIVGSVHYFSPEQAKNTSIGAKSDIYSLGVVLYEMITAKLPFTGDSLIGIALKHIQEDPVPPSEINPQIPPIIEAIILKAMAKEPALRFGNIKEMIADFKMAQNYISDNFIRRNSPNDFSTQVLPQIIFLENKDDENTPQKSGRQPSGKKLGNKNPPVKKSSKKLIGAGLLILLLSSALIAFIAFGNFGNLRDVNVPDVVGMQVDTARAALLKQNLKVSVSDAFNEQVSAGQVISQQPEAGITVKEERTINLVISKGAEITLIPDVRRLSFRDAQLLITNSGLVLGKVDEQYSEDITRDFVINQTPHPSAQAAKGTAVDIILSKGILPRKIIIPNLVGSPISSAKAKLEGMNLKLGSITEVESNEVAPGTIISQTPPAGSELDEGGSVGFSVAKPPLSTPNINSNSNSNSNHVTPIPEPEEVKRAQIQVTIPGSAGSGKNKTIKIVVNDSNGRRIVYEQRHKSGEKITKNVEGVGKVRIQVFIDNKLLQEQTL